MDVDFIIAAPACNDKSFKLEPGKGAKVGRCEKCQTMVWLSSGSLNLKKENPKFNVWCKSCVTTEKENTDTIFHFIEICEDDENENKDFNFDGKGFDEILSEVEERYFVRAQHGHDQLMAHLRQVLPSLLSCAMGRLKIWSNVEDLAIALMLRALVEGILLQQRETLVDEFGPGATFHGYEKEQIVTLLKFLFGTSKALEDARNKIKDGEFEFSDDVFDRWTEGWDHWHDGFHNNGNWGEDEGGW